MDAREKEHWRSEWRDLGFHVDLDTQRKLYTITGSKEGVIKFACLLESYVANPVNAMISEHDHYGPYFELEVMTWHKAGMDYHSIHGTLDDLLRLAIMVREILQDVCEGDVLSIRESYAAD